MSNKDDILKRYRANVREKYDMPDLSDIKAITYPNPLVQFIKMSEMVGGQVIEVDPGRDINALIRELFPDAKEIASNLPEICVWIPQTMKEKAVCFISENLVILLPKSQIVNNMHEAYKRIEFDKEYDGYGVFISGPSKTADIAQVLVMGAQAARSATILLLPE